MRIFNYFLTACLLLNLTQAKSQCNVAGSHYTASYPAGWTVTDMGTTGAGTDSYACNDGHNGTMYVSGSAAYFISARGGRELRASTAIPAVSNDNWTMDFTLIINPSFFDPALLPTNSPAVVLAALTSDQMSLQSGCSGGSLCIPCGSYANTNMDAMWVSLLSNAPNGCADSQAGKTWRIVASARDGNGTPNNSTAINIPTGVAGTYYIRLQRTGSQAAVVSVCTNSNYTGHVSGSPQCLGISGTVKDLDVLSHEVQAQETCTRTFNGIVDHLKIDNSLPCTMPLYASFTMPAYICLNQTFVVNGSATTTPNVPISHHLWAVEECNASGSSWWGPVWFSPAIAGAPSGNYTINPSTVYSGGGPYMQPEHYYRVSLIVASCANPWSSSSQVIQVGLNVNMSGSNIVTIPYNNQPTAWIKATGAGGSGSYTVNIYTGGFPPTSGSALVSTEVIQPGNSPVPHPFTQTSARNYYIEVIDNVSGCSARRSWWVSQGAAFNVELTSLTASSFTVKTQPEDVTGYETPGFYYSNVIEELDEDGNALYSHTSTDCWGSYPDGETFKGFISGGTGLFDQLPAPNCGDPGQFQRERRYRLTAITGASESDEQQYSVIISVGKSGELVVEEDLTKSAKMMERSAADVDAAASEISIHPNPSTGVFIIELEKTAEGSLIEVTNALGQKVKTLEAKGLRSELNLTGFTKGIYIITISSNGSTTTKKIILE